MIRRRALALAAVLLALAGAAGANSIASIVVRPDGEILFSDYVRNRIWGFRPGGALRVVLPARHTHHLVAGANGVVFFEHVTPDGSVASLWSLDARGTLAEVLPPRRRPDPSAYEGTVFVTGDGGELFFLRECRIVQRAVDGETRPFAGKDCGGAAWSDEKVRYGHLHGSLVRTAGGTLYFSDGRTIRRVSKDGVVSTLDGRPADLFAAPLPHEPAFERLMGLAVGDSGELYAALRKDSAIRRISPEGRMATLAQLGRTWTPTGLTFAKDALYALAEPRFPPLRALLGSPRLLRVSLSGKIEVLATAR